MGSTGVVLLVLLCEAMLLIVGLAVLVVMGGVFVGVLVGVLIGVGASMSGDLLVVGKIVVPRRVGNEGGKVGCIVVVGHFMVFIRRVFGLTLRDTI